MIKITGEQRFRPSTLSWLLVLLLLLMAPISPATAGPASPDPLIVTNPDGTSFTVHIRGDEFQNWTETEDGYSVVKNTITGYWEYAEKTAEGALSNSGVVYMPGLKAPAGIEKGLKPDRNTKMEDDLNQMLKEIYQQRSAPAGGGMYTSASGNWPPVPVSGTKKMLVILINFADRTLVTTPASWYSKIFDTTAGAKSMANYYYANSINGLMTISPAAHNQPGNPVPGIITVTISDNHPNYGGSPNFTTEATIINHALAAASSFINFASYDTSGNGYLEQSELSIYFIYAGYDASGTTKTPSIWAHATMWSGTGVTAGTMHVTRYAQNGELNNNDHQHPMGVIAHEMGHALCGLPDLYETSNPNVNAGLGIFSIMAGGSWGADTSISEEGGTTPVNLDAWARQYVGWATPVTPSAEGTITFPLALSSQSSSYKFVYPAISTAEYFLAENRYPTGWDLGMRTQLGNSWPGGLLIIHVDTNIGVPASNNINKWGAGAHQGVMAEEAKSNLCSLVNSLCRGNSQNLFYAANNATFNDSTSPNSKYYSGTSTGLWLSSISAPGTNMTALYINGIPAARPLTTTLFSDGFEGSGWYEAQMAGTTAYWYLYTSGSTTYPTGVTPHSGSYMAGFNSHTATAGDQSILYPSPISIPSSYDTVSLSFWMYHDTGSPAYADNVQVYASTDFGYNFASVGSALNRYDGTTGWAKVNLDLSAYQGQSSVLIGFLGTSAKGNDIYIDDITIVGNNTGGAALIGAANYYQSLTAAYAAASSGNVIKARGADFLENLLCNLPKNVTLDGGYDSAFLTNPGYTILHGKVTIQGGSVIVNRLKIK